MIADKQNHVHFSQSIAVAKKIGSEWPIYTVHVAFCGKGFPDRVHLGYQPKSRHVVSFLKVGRELGSRVRTGGWRIKKLINKNNS
jgi:hypothetical protein